MGGQLSCVSCKNRKETSTEAKAKKKSELQQTTEPLTTSTTKYCPVTSGLELYQILHGRNGMVKKEEEKMSDVEKVARAIVEINVYLASQVIYPAIEKYLQEIKQKDEKIEKDDKIEEVETRLYSVPHNENSSLS